MKTYTVEAFEGDGYNLVLCTTKEEEVKYISPKDYDTNILVVKTWLEGQIISHRTIETTNLF